jgi:hypothetical protein
VDADGDGIASSASGGTDCDDADSSVFPGSSETWKLELVLLDFDSLCGTPWQTECASLPAPHSLVVDLSGSAHLSFVAPGPDPGPTYASNQSGSWSFELINQDEATDPVVAVGLGGARYVAYSRDLLGTTVTLASSPSPTGAWTTQKIGTLIDTQINPRIATDPSGVVHLVATDRNKPAGGGAIQANDLYYTNGQANFVPQEVVLPGTEDMIGLSFVVSSSGTPHIAWHDQGTTTTSGPADPRVRYVEIDPSQSLHGGVVTVDDAGTHGDTFLTLDASDEPVISYWRMETNGSVSLRLAQRSAGVWAYDTVLSASATRPAPVAFGAGGLHLCSVDGQSLEYFSKTAGTWSAEIVVGNVTSRCLFVYDELADSPHLAFQMNNRMWHAYPEASPGVDKNCDGADD